MAESALIFLDTNIFIYAIERPIGIDIGIADLLLDLIAINLSPERLAIAASELTLAEVLVAPYKANDVSLVAKYEGVFAGNLSITVEPISLDILRAAALIRSSNTAIKLPDAIHLATASALKCSHFLTADIALANNAQKMSFPIPIMQPRAEFLTALIKGSAPNA